MQRQTVGEIIHVLEQFAPSALQENYDNAGLIVGSLEDEVNGVLLCLDSTEPVIDEAIRHGCNLIIAHHPIIFKGIKKINGKNYVERAIIKAIKNNISIYAAHTNLDNVISGVNKKIADKIGLKKIEILRPKTGQLNKLIAFCPVTHAENLRKALFSAGAGTIGNYDSCSFNTEGIGTFRGNNHTNPFVGNKGELHKENEVRIEIVFPSYMERTVLNTLITHHPYEEVAYDIYPLQNNHSGIGSGLRGELDTSMNEIDFMMHLKRVMNIPVIKHTELTGRPVKNVALCGGSGSFLLKDAINYKSDIYISSDFKYHEFFDADKKILIADIGHFESEQYTSEIFYEVIKEKFPTFAIRFSEFKTNPVNYL